MKKKTTDPLVNEYLKEVSDGLVCPKARKKYVLDELETLIDDFVRDNPGCGIEDLLGEFGTPEKFREGLETDGEYAELYEKAKKKTRIMTVVSVLLALLLIFAIISIVIIIRELGGHVTISDVKEIYRITD